MQRCDEGHVADILIHGCAHGAIVPAHGPRAVVEIEARVCIEHIVVDVDPTLQLVLTLLVHSTFRP